MREYVTHSSHPFEIELAEEEHLLQAVSLVNPDEVQDDRQRWKNAAAQIIATKNIRIAALQAKLVACEETLERITDWCDAYPMDFAGGMFNKPDMAEVHRLLGPELLTKLSAYNFRHVLNGIKAIINPPQQGKL